MTNDDAEAIKAQFGVRLRAARQAAGLSQEAVGAFFGVGKGTVSAWETGRGDPGVVKLAALAKLLGTTPNDLLA